MVHGRNDPDGPGLNYTVLVHHRRWIATATTFQACARQWSPRRSAPIPAGTPARMVTATVCSGGFEGSYIPFPETPSEQAATGDPRDAILQRYPTKQAYRAAIVAAAREIGRARPDAGRRRVLRCADMAADWGRPRHDVSLMTTG